MMLIELLDFLEYRLLGAIAELLEPLLEVILGKDAVCYRAVLLICAM